MTSTASSPTPTRRILPRLVPFVRPYAVQVALVLVAIIASAALQLVQPQLVKLLIDRYLPAGDLAGVGLIAAYYVATLVGTCVIEYGEAWTMQMTGQSVMFDLRMAIVRHLQRLDLAYYDRHSVGGAMTQVTADVDAINELFTANVVSLVSDVAALVGIVIVLFWIDWRLALVASAVLPLMALVVHWFRVHLRDGNRETRVWLGRLHGFLQEHLAGMTTVQVCRRGTREIAAFDELNLAHRDAHLRLLFYYQVLYPAIELISALAVALLLWVGGGWVLRGTVSLGVLVAFVQYVQRFFRPISELAEKVGVLQGVTASLERIFELLDTPVAVVSPPTPMARRVSSAGSIRFERVTFGYDPARPVLRDVSFDVHRGQRVGIVGATGAGKSTLMNLLLRFYDVQSGRITIDGIDLRHLDLDDVRSRCGLVMQDVQLFSGSIADNVRLGRAGVGDRAVRAALEAVHAHTFVDRLPEGVRTIVSARGETLSAGQKQLLAFARALAADPAVLILDEATSSVDTETERLIREALRTLMRGRTTLAIAHRLSTVQDMDVVLVMHKGELREQGTHEALLARGGLYRALCAVQFGMPTAPNEASPVGMLY